MEIMWKFMGIMWEIHGNNVGFIMGIIILYLKFKWIVNGKIHMDVTHGTKQILQAAKHQEIVVDQTSKNGEEWQLNHS